MDNDTNATSELVKLLNEDLESEFQSIVQFVQHIATISGAEYTSTVDELKIHIPQELAHATTLAEQVAFLGGTPATASREIKPFEDSRGALQADLDLEVEQLERYRTRVQEATELGLIDVSEALRPLLTQTQEHVRDLSSALGL